MNRPDSALMSSLLFTVLSCGLLTISYSKIFIERPLLKLTTRVDQHTDQIEILSKLVNAQFRPTEARKITSFYEDVLNEKR
jgi:hypothetical protein